MFFARKNNKINRILTTSEACHLANPQKRQMRKILAFLFITTLSISLNAQVFSGKGSLIPDNGTEKSFPIQVEGVVAAAENFGLAAVQLDINHSWTSDLEIYLVAPDGFKYQLSIANGGSGQNYTNTVFTMNAAVNITDAEAPFAGSFLPQDNLNYANKTKNTNGVWTLVIKDTALENVGVLNNWSLSFGAIAPFSVQAAPACGSNLPAAATCGGASIVCNFDGYCGNTSSTYAPPNTWTALSSTFNSCAGGASLQNNSFIKFVAANTSVTLNVWVVDFANPTRTGSGIQYMIFGGTCNGAVTAFGCSGQLSPTTGGINGVPTPLTATGLTIGQTYYLMFDGFSGQVWDYVVGIPTTGGGISVFDLTPINNKSICNVGDAVTLTASGSSTYTWTGPAGFVPPASNTQSIISVTIPGTYTVSSTGGCASKSVTLAPYISPYNTPTVAQDLYSATTFNLRSNESYLLNGQNATDFVIRYHRTQQDAINVANPIPNPLTYTIQPATASQENIWVSLTDNRTAVGGCVTAFSFFINKLLPVVASNSGPICADAINFNLFCTSAGPGYTYQWTGPNGFTSTVQNPTTVPMPTGTGPYVYTVTPIGTPSLLPQSTTLVINAVPTITAPATVTCANTNLQLTGSGTAAAVNPWVSSAPTVATINNTGLLRPVTAGSTVITYTDSNGCSQSTTITVNALPVISGASATFVTYNEQLTATGTPAATNPWRSSNTAVATISNTGLVTGLSAGITAITFTNTDGCVSLPRALVVNPLITPTFGVIAPQCYGSTIAPLPTTSLEGITGTWSPAINNIATTVYTFTPDSGQGAINATTTIVILPQVIISGNTSGCVGRTIQLTGSQLPAAVAPWTSSDPAVATVSNSGLVTTRSSGTTVITYRNILNCTATQTITVFAIPTATISGTASACFSSTNRPVISFTGANGVAPYTFTYNINGGAIQTITTPPGSNIATLNASTAVLGTFNYNLISVADANCNQVQIGRATIRIITAPVLVSTNVTYTVCDDSTYPNYANDGIATFTLNTQNVFFTGGNPNVTVSYYETQQDAQNGFAGNIAPNIYVNGPTSNILYVRVTDNSLPGDCASYGILNLVVNPNPIPTLVIPDFVKCDDTSPYNGTEIFDLHLYDAICGMTPGTTTATYFANDPSITTGNPQLNFLHTSGNATIWVKLTDNITGCWGKRPFNLVVNSLPIISKPVPSYTLCETTTPPDFVESFNLASQNTIVSSVTGVIVSYHLNLADAQGYNAILGTGTALPAVYVNATPNVQTIWVKVTNNITGCADYSTMDLRVNQLPSPVQPLTPYVSCSLDQLGLGVFNLFTIASNISSTGTVNFYSTYATAEQGGTSASSPPNNAHIPTVTNYQVVTPFSEIIFARVENSSGCFKIVAIQLDSPPAPLAPTTGLLHDLVACDDKDSNNQDGFTSFDLTEALITASNANLLLGIQPLAAANYTIKYHTTLAAAMATTGAFITTPTNYINGSASPQQIWISIENNSTKCRNWGTFNLIVNKPLQLITPPQYNKCDDDKVLPPRVSFDLTTQNPIILSNVVGSTAGYTVTYYPSIANSLAGTNAISAATAVAYTNAPVLANGSPDPNGNAQTLGVVVTTPDGCKSYTQVTIKVLPLPNPRTTNLPTPVFIACDKTTTPPDGKEIFDLTVNQTYIDNAGGYRFEYYTDSSLSAASLIATPAVALVGTGIIYVKVMNNELDWQGNRCYAVVQMPVIVNPLPVLSKINPTGPVTPIDLTNTYQICKQPGSPLPANQEVFDLTSKNTVLLAGNPAPLTNFTVTYYLTAAAATAGTGALTTAQATAFVNTASNPQTIYIRAVNNTTGCINTGSYNLLVNPQPIIAFNLLDFARCDNTDGNNDGLMLYPQNTANLGVPSLAGWVDTILGPTQTGGGFTVTIYTTQTLAAAGVPSTALQNLATDLLQTGTYWIRVENIATKCYVLDDFIVTIEKIITPVITSLSPNKSNTICVKWGTNTIIPGSEVILDSGIPAAQAANYTYEWFIDVAGVPTSLGAPSTANTYTIGGTAPAGISNDYSVAIKSTTTLACPSNASRKFKVYRSGPPELLNPSYTITNAFATNQTIVVNVDGFADLIGVGSGYKYNIDDGAWQSSDTFENLPLGNHTITIMDMPNALKNNTSCGSKQILNAQIIDYPHFFTPNGDGINDVWNVSGLSNQPDAKIYIFDRYGKLLKQISSCQGCGWDGTIIGQQLPADDYWFTIEFGENSGIRTFKSHFTLKR